LLLVAWCMVPGEALSTQHPAPSTQHPAPIFLQ
jgi:hypothetical protein